jgi:hypothetical protein
MSLVIGGGISFGGGISVTNDSTGLYNFSSFTFLPGGLVGPVGPTAAQLFANSYSNVGNTWLQSTSFYNTYGNGYQFWTVPATGTYQITAAGARAGIGPSTYYQVNTWVGNGAIISAALNLNQGQVLTFVVGQPAFSVINTAYWGPGGGGGTFVADSSNNPLIVAGGGGAQGYYSSVTPNSFAGSNGLTSTFGGNSATGAPGGANGQGGNSHVLANGTVSQNPYDSGGGGGFYSNGVVGNGGNVRSTVAGTTQSGGGGAAFIYGANGGQYASTYGTADSYGGFGGGGGGGPITGGAGGGYSGGGGAFTYASTKPDGGGGGGSYITSTASNVSTSDGNYANSSTFNGSSISNLAAYNNGPGYITVTRIA